MEEGIQCYPFRHCLNDGIKDETLISLNVFTDMCIKTNNGLFECHQEKRMTFQTMLVLMALSWRALLTTRMASPPGCSGD